MSQPDPRVTVLLPVYNGGALLPSAIESILEQDFDAMELVVIDDGSTDASSDVIETYAQADTRVRAFHQGNRGLVVTLNRGIRLARAPFIARMDADDLSLPGRLQAQLEAFTGRPDLAVIGGFTRIVDEQGRFLRMGRYPLRGREVEEFIERGSPVAHPAVMMRKAAVLAVGGYRPAFRHCEDYDLWLRLHDMGFAIENLPRPVIAYRHHPGSVSLRHKHEQALGTMAARAAHEMRRRGLPDPVTDDTVIDEHLVVELFRELPGDLRAELLEALYSDLPLATYGAIAQALFRIREVPRTEANRRVLARLLLRAALGLWRERRPLAAVARGLEAVRCSPGEVARAVRLRLREAVLLRLREGRG